jgi:hypothetical protein
LRTRAHHWGSRVFISREKRRVKKRRREEEEKKRGEESAGPFKLK